VTETVVVTPVLIGFVTVVVTLLAGRRRRLERAASLLGAVAYVVGVAALVRRVLLAPGGPDVVVYRLGGWVAPFGITLVADALSAFMLAIAAVVGLFVVAFSAAFITRENQGIYYHPLYHFLLLGATGAFLTGDLFNLFVWFEVMLMASYVFVAFYGGAEHTAAATRYVVVNVVGSALMLLSIGGLYATLGTLNMADMALVAADPATEAAPIVGLSALVFSTFALKAGLVPFQFWVPSAYRAAPIPIAAMLAGVTKKVGLYAIVRLYFTVFADASVPTTVPWLAGGSPLSYLAAALAVMAALSIAVGGVGAVGRETLDGLLAYSSVGQVGFIAVAVAVAAAAPSRSLRHLGLLAGLIYALHHALTKSMLFLAAAAVRDATGTTRLADLGGLGGRSPVFAGAFLVGGLSMVGIPPLSGFFGKFLIFRTGIEAVAATPTLGGVLVVGVLLGGAVLTVVYVTRAWSSSVWGTQTPAVRTARFDRTQLALLATLAGLVVLVGVGFEPVYAFADAAATAALETEAYVEAVDPGGGSA